ncbi:COQ9 family protein [Maritimibacter sp. UBA3975]|uniref:COQ9 family protein n=1 Tax=Maritimibacter sp. UBA3975 TaxID=1946833 RepID=UPI000C0911FC|nr:COQ9 family protein [Maritimibacter sp. UBA3975]MAM63697.1 COQ9 family protein [Maritimibacter sp.]|tara:strand:- start:5737 stop:6414 length:678 start_codon:yes stop_codon:yes gene_type:complete
MTHADQLLDAVQMHVPFDGWSEVALKAACEDTGIPLDEARALFPRGGVDLAFAYHERGDRQMVEALRAADLTALRFRDRIAFAVRTRLEVADRELVRRGMSLFALPQHAADGSRALWGTAGLIWETLGDTSDDINWYTKRATLSAVYSSTVLYWLGDESEGRVATWAFLDRRIDNVMKFEQVKGRVRSNTLVDAFMKGPGRVFDHIRAPGTPRSGYPGQWGGRGQ